MLRLNKAQAKAAGIGREAINDRAAKAGMLRSRAEKRRQAEIDRKAREDAFNALCEAWGLPRPVYEYEFAKDIGRKWRFDLLFDGWLAVEKVGGVWVRGHHSRGKDQIDDMEKKNWAVRLGYAVLEFTPQQFDDGSALKFIQEVLNGGPEVQS